MAGTRWAGGEGRRLLASGRGVGVRSGVLGGKKAVHGFLIWLISDVGKMKLKATRGVQEEKELGTF